MIYSLFWALIFGATLFMAVGFLVGAYYGSKAENRRITNLFKKRFPYIDIDKETDETIQSKTADDKGNKSIPQQIIVEIKRLRPSSKNKNKLH